MTKVIIINGSAKTEKGNTAFVLAPLIKGMEQAGAEVKIFYSKKLNILPCIGCFKCWNETIGSCFQDDDMKMIYPKLKTADILVLATPVYIPLPGMFQNFLNRLCPLLEPILKFKNGRTRAKLHDDVNFSKIVAVVTGGWWEIENLSLVKEIIAEFSLTSSIEFSGAILRPHSYLLRQDTEKNKEIFISLENIGKKLIIEGKIEKNDLQFVSQPLVNRDVYIERSTNNYLKRKENYILKFQKESNLKIE